MPTRVPGFESRNFGHLVAVTDVKLFRLRFADLRQKSQQYLSFLEKVSMMGGSVGIRMTLRVARMLLAEACEGRQDTGILAG